MLTDDNFATLVRAADLGRDRPALPMFPGNSVRPGAAVPGLPWANSQVTSTCLGGICHSNATQSKEDRFHIRKAFMTWSPLRNRTVDLLLTMNRRVLALPLFRHI